MKVVEKVKKNSFCVTNSWKLCHLWDTGEKYGRGRQATNDNTIWCMHFACMV